jgi:fructokinase
MSNISPVLVGGEALFDFISTDVGSGLGGSISFEKRAGGSPFNIAVGIRRSSASSGRTNSATR